MQLVNPEVRLEPTNRCNGQCIMCPREKMTRHLGVMDLNLYRDIVDQCVAAGAKKISLENYGETFLDPYIFNRAEYAKAKGLQTLTITNGSFINTGKIIEFFDIIRISLYAVTEETFNKIHKGLDFRRITSNVDRLFEAAKNTNLKIQMYFLLMEENKHELDAWLEKYEPLTPAIAVWKPHNWGDGRAYRPQLFPKRSCNRPFTGSLQVQWNGEVVPCCFDYDSRMVLGDFNKQTLSEIMKSEAYNKLREAHKRGAFADYPFCNGCDQLNKRDDVLVYTTIKDAKVGCQNTNYFKLQ